MNNTTGNACVKISAGPVSDMLMVVNILAFSLGLVVNLITLGPILQQVRGHNVLGVYLLNLAISDILYIFTMPLWIVYHHAGHVWKLGQVSCQVAGFLFYSNMYISIYLLCCISVDRCLTVSYPLWARTARRSRYAWGICGAVTLVIMGMHAAVLALDSPTDILETGGRCYEKYPMPILVARFNLIRVGLGFILPLLVLAVCYWHIFGKVQRSKAVDWQGKRKVRLLSVGVIAIFSIFFAPYHLLLAVRSLAVSWMTKWDNCVFEQQLHFYFSCALALSSFNSVVDPVLYVLVSNGVKEDIRLCCMREQKPGWEPKAVATIQSCLPSLV